jgi:SAM-dependent methyltransferase
MIYDPSKIEDLHARSGPAVALTEICAYLASDTSDPEAWSDAAVVAFELGASEQALEFGLASLEIDPTQPGAREVVDGLGGTLPRVTARHRLEGWVRSQRARLQGPVLDVGTSRSERSWIDAIAERLTLDVCREVYDASTEKPDIQADLEDLSVIEDARFGSVLCTEVLEHVHRPERALAELLRVTAPGGSLLLSVPWFYPFHPCPLDLRRFTAQGLTMVVQDAGWGEVQVSGLPLPPRAHALIVEAVTEMTGRRCPAPESMGFSNWVLTALRP